MQVHSQVVWQRRGGGGGGGGGSLLAIQPVGGGGGGGGGCQKGIDPPWYGPEQGGGGGGSLAMGQIREYKEPQSAFRPDAKKIKLDGGRTQPSNGEDRPIPPIPRRGIWKGRGI